MTAAPASGSAARSSLRELIPSFPNTLPRCHSTVRGLRNSWAPIFRVRLPAGGQSRDLRFLRGQLVERLDRALAHCLAGGQQLAVGALGERLQAHVREHRVSDSQLLAGVDAAMLAPQPFAVQEMRAGQRRAGLDVRQPLDRVPVEPLGGFPLGQHRRRARVGPQRPVRAGGARNLSEPGERTGRALRLAAARGGLNQPACPA